MKFPHGQLPAVHGLYFVEDNGARPLPPDLLVEFGQGEQVPPVHVRTGEILEVEEEDTPFPVVVDHQGTIFDKFFGSRHNAIVPCSYLLDPQGRVAIRMTGFRMGQSISRQLFEARRIR